MTMTRKIRGRVAAGAAALFVAVFSVLWSQAPTTTQTAQNQAVTRHGHQTTIVTRTSGGRTITTVVNANGAPQSLPVTQAGDDS